MTGPNRPILYIEDEEDYQILVQRILARAGISVRIADTGEQGLAQLRLERPPLLILDINLPDTDGYQICQQLRQDPAWADLPILMLTVRRRPEEWLRGFSCGANDYLSKPLNPPELIERVQNGLSGKMQQASSPGTPEYQLIQAAVGGNRAAFEVLIQKYKTRLIDNLRQAGRDALEADDLAAHAFLLAFEHLKKFRGDASFYTWLYRIAMNDISHRQRKNRDVSLDELTQGDDTALPAVFSQPDAAPAAFSENPSSEQIAALLKSVPEPFRQMLDMYFLQDHSYEAIAKKLGIPLGTVMSRLFKARTLLRETWHRSHPGSQPAG